MRRVVVLSILLSGCVDVNSPKFAEQSDATCRSYGAQPGTDMYVACRMRLAEMQTSENNRKRQAFSDGMDSMNEDIQRNQDRQALIAAAERRKRQTCESYINGNRVSTSCY